MLLKNWDQVILVLQFRDFSMHTKYLSKSRDTELNLAGFVLQFGVLNKMKAGLNLLVVIHVKISYFWQDLYRLNLFVQKMLFKLLNVGKELRLPSFFLCATLNPHLLEHNSKLLQANQLIWHTLRSTSLFSVLPSIN